MTLKRLTGWTAFLAVVLLGGTVGYGQGLIGNLQLFAPPEVDLFGGGRQASEGFFFCYDQLYWWVQGPEAALIGAKVPRRGGTIRNFDFPDPAPLREYYVYIADFPTNSYADTSGLNWQATWGERFELGWMGRHDGIMVSFFNLPQSQHLVFRNVEVSWDDPEGRLDALLVAPATSVVGWEVDRQDDQVQGGLIYWAPPPSDLPPDFLANVSACLWVWGGVHNVTRTELVPIAVVRFDQLDVRHRVNTWGVELEYLRRSHQFRRGGYLELFAGVRYLEFDDRIRFQGSGMGSDLWRWELEAENHIVGPQVGARYFKLAGRWMLNAEGRFLAGFNSQNIHLAHNLPPVGNHTSEAAYQNEWSPLAELRLELRYLLTKAINLRVGWTGMWMDGLARSPYMIRYTLPFMGIDMSNNQEDAFVHGLTFGVDINR